MADVSAGWSFWTSKAHYLSWIWQKNRSGNWSRARDSSRRRSNVKSPCFRTELFIVAAYLDFPEAFPALDAVPKGVTAATGFALFCRLWVFSSRDFLWTSVSPVAPTH